MSDSYVYTALLLSKVGRQITGENIMNILQAGGIEADAEKANRLAQALDGVDMAEVIKSAGMFALEVPTPQPESKKEAPKPEEHDDVWGIGEGLSKLFG